MRDTLLGLLSLEALNGRHFHHCYSIFGHCETFLGINVSQNITSVMARDSCWENISEPDKQFCSQGMLLGRNFGPGVTFVGIRSVCRNVRIGIYMQQHHDVR